MWVELPNVGGDSHRFDEIEPYLRPMTTETMIGSCRARRVAMRDVLNVATRLIQTDHTALLCDDQTCRCSAAAKQALGHRDE